MKNLENYIVKKDWIFVTRSGTSGIVVYADASFDGLAVSEHVIRIIPNTKEIDAGYLYAILSSPIFEPIFESAITGSVIDEITPNFIKGLEIPVPDDPKEQEKIGNKIKEAEKNIASAKKSFIDVEKNIDEILK